MQLLEDNEEGGNDKEQGECANGHAAHYTKSESTVAELKSRIAAIRNLTEGVL